MDENVGYVKTFPGQDEEKWALERKSVLSFEERASNASISQSQDYYLYLKQRKEVTSNRPIIPSTKMERLSFYRAYISSPCKTQIICMQQNQFNPFLWYYLMDVFFKSLPHTFVHIFLASYAQEEHIFLPQMLPICLGFKYLLILASYFDLATYIGNVIYLLHYTVSSVVYNNPWNRCSQEYYSNLYSKTVRCYELMDFAKQFVNDSPVFQGEFYVSGDNQSFTLPQLVFYRKIDLHTGSSNYLYCVFLWILIAVLDNQVLKRSFWKMLNRCQWTVSCIDLLSFGYVLITYYQDKFANKKSINTTINPNVYKLWEADLDMVSESASAPPVIHVLTARSTQKIDPSGDSAIIMLSNALCFILRGLLTHRVKKYCESYVNAPIFFSYFNQHAWFYFFPIFFSTFHLGGLYTKLFFVMNFLSEVLTLTVTYHCFIEVVVYEWKSLKRWMAVSILTVVGFGLFVTTKYDTRLTLYLYGKSLATLFEIVFIYLLYPLGRLVDDHMFHTGEQMTTFRVLSLRIVPLFYTIKVYKLWKFLIDVEYGVFKKIWWGWVLLLGPFIYGTISVLYTHIIQNKMNWNLLFRPSPTWGPRDLETRLLRKQYDSRYYIGSQYPRLLSRHLLKKSEPETYELDLRYDIEKRSSRRSTMTPQPQESKLDIEKKLE